MTLVCILGGSPKGIVYYIWSHFILETQLDAQPQNLMWKDFKRWGVGYIWSFNVSSLSVSFLFGIIILNKFFLPS